MSAPARLPRSSIRGINVVLRATSGSLVVDAASQCAGKLQPFIGDKRLILVSTDAADAIVKRHEAAGGRALVFAGSDSKATIEFREGSQVIAIFPVSPHLQGTGEGQELRLLRRLHAIGVAVGAEMPVSEIEKALTRQAQMHR